MQNYAMRGMSRRYMEGAPEDVRKAIVDIIAITAKAWFAKGYETRVELVRK